MGVCGNVVGMGGSLWGGWWGWECVGYGEECVGLWVGVCVCVGVWCFSFLTEPCSAVQGLFSLLGGVLLGFLAINSVL